MALTIFFTLGVAFVTVAVVAAYDIWAYRSHGYHATISYLLLSASQKRPIVAALIGLALGILLGHLFWPQQP
jgi:hypothetical protein